MRKRLSLVGNCVNVDTANADAVFLPLWKPPSIQWRSTPEEPAPTGALSILNEFGSITALLSHAFGNVSVKEITFHE
jgi:hypothetical protein